MDGGATPLDRHGTSNADQRARHDPEWRDVPCATFEIPLEHEALEGLDVECGEVAVPEDHFSGSGEVHIAVVRARPASGSTGTPIFYMRGGPGPPAIEETTRFVSNLRSSIDSGRDFVLTDRRGIGYSRPNFACAPPPASEKEGEAPPYELMDDWAAKCRSGFAEDPDLYNGRQDALDIDAVRRALGYRRIVLVGESWGTLLAQHLMSLAADGTLGDDHVFEAVVLGSPLPLGVPWTVSSHAAAVQDTFDGVFAACEADSPCREAHGGIGERFYATLEALDSASNGVNGPAIPSSAAEFVGSLHFRKSGDLFGSLLARIEQMHDVVVDGADAASLAHEEAATETPAALDDDGKYPGVGAGYAVLCHEAAFVVDEPPSSSHDAIATVAATYIEHCAAWCNALREGVPAMQYDLAPLDVPVLILSGSLDYVTPPRYGEQIARMLPRSRHLIVPNRGHNVVGIDECVDEIVRDFVDQPGSELDARSCLANLRPLFYRRDRDRGAWPDP